MFAPHAHRFRMCRQSFGLGKTLDRRRNPSQSRARKLLHRDDLHKIRDAQAAAKSRLPRSRQHVVRPRGVVARSLRRVIPDEYRARILNERQVLSRDGDVFRGEQVRPFACLFAGAATRICPRFRRLPGRWDSPARGSPRSRDRSRQLARCRDEHGQRIRIMLGLRDQIGRNEFRDPPSLRTTASVGPARKSIAQSKETNFFATVT